MSFFGKNAMITGAAVGIGRACALKFASEGADGVALFDRNEEGLQALKEELSAYPVKVFTAVCDISSEEEVNAAVAQAQEALGSIDILVNNAALWRNVGPFMETPISQWNQYININVMGTVYCTRAVLPGMMARKYGRIINVSSITGVYGKAKMVPYSATKAAVNAITHGLAEEMAEYGITVNAVCPGTVSPSNEKDIHYTCPNPLNYMGRTGSDSENADLICFLAGENAGYITGQSILIDGCRMKI